MRFDLIADVLVWLDPHVMVQVQATSAVVHHEMKRVWRETRREHVKFDEEFAAVSDYNARSYGIDRYSYTTSENGSFFFWHRRSVHWAGSKSRWAGCTSFANEDNSLLNVFVKHNRDYPHGQYPPNSRLLLQVLEDHWSGHYRVSPPEGR